MTKIRTHYDNLKVARNAPDIVIKAAHKALLQLHHPDKASDKEKAERITRILNDAREVLLDPIRRKQHDNWIKEQERLHQQRHSTNRAAQADEAGTKPEPAKPEADAAVNEQRIAHYIAYANGVALDTESGLHWCRFVLGQRWYEQTAQGEASVYNWLEAFAAAKDFNAHGGFAGHRDWRLPTVQELKSLLTKPDSAAYSHINTDVFPNNPPWLWSATPYAGYGGGYWFVNFNDGIAINESENFHRSVRLVRN